jgi:hypothetical protein
VEAPFVAPPTDGVKTRRWVAFSIALVAVLLCCAGGVAGFGGLIYLGDKAIIAEAKQAVTQYLTKVQNNDFAGAYKELCAEFRAKVTEDELANSWPVPLTGFTVGEPVITSSILVPAQLNLADGRSGQVTYLVTPDKTTSAYHVCGVSTS